MKLFQELIKVLKKYKFKPIKYHYNGKEINLTSDQVSINSNNFSVDTNGNMSCNNASIKGTVEATSGVFQNCTITDSCSVPASTVNGTLANDTIPNLSASKVTSGTMSGDRISGGKISGSSLSGISVSADVIGLHNEYGSYSVGDYVGKSARVDLGTGQTLVFKCGILVGIE